MCRVPLPEPPKPSFKVLPPSSSSSKIVVVGERAPRGTKRRAEVIDLPLHLTPISPIKQVDGSEGEVMIDVMKKENKNSDMMKDDARAIVKAAMAAKRAGVQSTKEIIYVDELLGPGWYKTK